MIRIRQHAVVATVLACALALTGIHAKAANAADAAVKAPDPALLPEMRRSAEGGSAVSQFNLARRYALGQGGVDKDQAQAVLWMTKSADQGLAIAQNALAFW